MLFIIQFKAESSESANKSTNTRNNMQQRFEKSSQVAFSSRSLLVQQKQQRTSGCTKGTRLLRRPVSMASGSESMGAAG